MVYPDIYFEKSWGELNSVLIKDGMYRSYTFENEKGCVYYHFIMRPAQPCIDGVQYYDIITPYGFNGPIVIDCEPGKREALVQDFDRDFDRYCREQSIVAEYIRFNPWLYNHKDFGAVYTLKYNDQTYAIDLSHGDFFKDEYSHSARNQTKKAQNSGLKIEFDFEGKTIEPFLSLYRQTIQKNNIGEAYHFSNDFLCRAFELCGASLFFANAYFEGKIVSSQLYLQHDRYLHGHLEGNDYAFKHLYANNLIFYETCKWGIEHGKEYVHLGGAHHESLKAFKKQFTRKSIFDFYIGTKIRNQSIYDQLVRINGYNPDFFPAYR